MCGRKLSQKKLPYPQEVLTCLGNNIKGKRGRRNGEDENERFTMQKTWANRLWSMIPERYANHKQISGRRGNAEAKELSAGKVKSHKQYMGTTNAAGMLQQREGGKDGRDKGRETMLAGFYPGR